MGPSPRRPARQRRPRRGLRSLASGASTRVSARSRAPACSRVRVRVGSRLVVVETTADHYQRVYVCERARDDWPLRYGPRPPSLYRESMAEVFSCQNSVDSSTEWNSRSMPDLFQRCQANLCFPRKLHKADGGGHFLGVTFSQHIASWTGNRVSRTLCR